MLAAIAVTFAVLGVLVFALGRRLQAQRHETRRGAVDRDRLLDADDREPRQTFGGDRELPAPVSSVFMICSR